MILCSSHGTITAKYAKHIRQFASRGRIKEYLSKKYNWNRCYALIDWNVHGTSVSRDYSRKNFIVKYVHNWLPVGSHVSRYDVQYPASCPSCSCDNETILHMLQCSKRENIRKKFIHDVQMFIEKYDSLGDFHLNKAR